MPDGIESALQSALALTIRSVVLVTLGVDDPTEQPNSTQAGSSNRVAQARDRSGDSPGGPHLEVVLVGALGAVEAVLRGVGIGLGGGSVGVRVGDLGGLAGLASADAVVLVDEAGGDEGREDVAAGWISGRPWSLCAEGGRTCTRRGG